VLALRRCVSFNAEINAATAELLIGSTANHANQDPR
jgi:hypothetical protein